MQSIILLGGGGHAAAVAEAAKAAGYVVEGYLDDTGKEDAPDLNAQVVGFKHLGPTGNLKSVKVAHRHAVFHAAVEDPALRQKWLQLVQPRLTPAIVHPSAVVSPSARIADAVFIGANAVVSARASIAVGAIVKTGAIIEHDCILEPFCHIGPGCILAGEVTIGQATLIGAGCIVNPRVRIGSHCNLGPGAVAVDDIADHSTAFGVPARLTNAPQTVEA
ncbi:MAG: acetyltransferase [Phycisphaerales bacterium]|nr:acetyltransferase [Phycisphaerales bacterium]MCI0630434.1 acetyltransferase [Phycisphaerales bacterium]